MSGPNEDENPNFLAVTNGSKDSIKAGFHGQLYNWKPGETVHISIEAAKHIFGFGMDDKTSAFHRLGWISSNPGGMPKDAQRKLEQMVFQPVLQVFTAAQSSKAVKRSKTVVAEDAELLDDAVGDV